MRTSCIVAKNVSSHGAQRDSALKLAESESAFIAPSAVAALIPTPTHAFLLYAKSELKPDSEIPDFNTLTD
jgi:hypothetical protein